MQYPDAWAVIIDNANNLLRIFAQYRADGFAAQRHWKISSGFRLKDITKRDKEYVITQVSGTTYHLRKEDEGFGDAYMNSKFTSILAENNAFSQTKIELELSSVEKEIVDMDNVSENDSKLSGLVRSVNDLFER
jgi:hypothetical protein